MYPCLTKRRPDLSLVPALVIGFSIFCFHKALAQEPGNLGLSALLEVDHQDALSVNAERIIKECSTFLAEKEKLSKSNVYRLLLLRGNVYYRSNVLEKALKDFDGAIELMGKDSLAGCRRADTLANSGSIEVAKDEYKSLIRINPGFSQAHASLAGCYLIGGDFDHCVESAGKAIALDPTTALAYRWRSQAYLVHGEWELALQDANKCIDLGYGAGSPLASAPYLVRGHALLSLGKPELALRAFLIAGQLDPSSIQAGMGMWSVYFNTGKYDLCLKLSEQMASQKEWLVFHCLTRVVSLIVRRNGEEALKVAEEGIRLHADEPLVYWQLGNCHFALGNYEAALESYNAILNVNDQEMFICASKAFMLGSCPDEKYRDGRTALKLARECCRRSGNQNPRFLMILAMAHAECGEFSEAVSAAKKALSVARPDFHLRKEYENRLRLFEQNKTYRFSIESKAFDFLWF